MSTAIKFTESVEDSVLNALETSQRWTSESFKALAATYDGVIPATPAVPFTDALPTPEEAIEVTFGFAEKVLAANRAFVSDLLSIAVSPAAPKTTPVKTAPKTTAV